MCIKEKVGIKKYPINYWKKERDRILINEKLKELVTDFFTQVSIEGIDKILTKENVQELYKKYCGNS